METPMKDSAAYATNREKEIEKLYEDAKEFTIANNLSEEIMNFLEMVRKYHGLMMFLIRFSINKEAEPITQRLTTIRTYIIDEVARLRKIYKNKQYGKHGAYVHDVLLKEEKIGF